MLFWCFHSIVGLWLDTNSLAGSIPSEIGLLTSMSNLWMCAWLLFTVTIELKCHCILLGSNSADWLELNNNSLKSTIPSEIALLTSLCKFWLLFHSSYFDSLMLHLDLHCAALLVLHSNSLMGAVPSEVGLLTSLSELWCCFVVATVSNESQA